MIFSLCIQSSPASAASYSAYQFAKAVIAQGHSLHRVFFYHEGAYHGSSFTCPPQDSPDLVDCWQQLQVEHSLDMVVCIAAGIKRGVLDQTEADRYEKPGHNLADGFELAGLGQLVDAAVASDRLITFGG